MELFSSQENKINKLIDTIFSNGLGGGKLNIKKYLVTHLKKNSTDLKNLINLGNNADSLRMKVEREKDKFPIGTELKVLETTLVDVYPDPAQRIEVLKRLCENHTELTELLRKPKSKDNSSSINFDLGGLLGPVAVILIILAILYKDGRTFTTTPNQTPTNQTQTK